MGGTVEGPLLLLSKHLNTDPSDALYTKNSDWPSVKFTKLLSVSSYISYTVPVTQSVLLVANETSVLESCFKETIVSQLI